MMKIQRDVTCVVCESVLGITVISLVHATRAVPDEKRPVKDLIVYDWVMSFEEFHAVLLIFAIVCTIDI